MAVIRWEPFREMKSFLDVFDHLPERVGWDLAVDLYEEEDSVVAELNAPGIDPQNIHIEIDHGYLTISGSREHKEEKKDKNYHSKEIRRGSFSRTIQLPTDVDLEATKADYKNGVLKVIMPKKENKKTSKKIAVSVS